MKYCPWLRHIMNITYEQTKQYKNIDLETGRVYEVPLGKYPSITTILGSTSDKTYLQIWKDKIGEAEAARIVKKASERGSAVHDYVEKYSIMYKDFSKGNFEEFYESSGLNTEPELYRALVKKFIKTLTAYNFVSIASEFVVWDDELKFAGRCDSVGLINNKLTIVDFKTSTKLKNLNSTTIKDYRLQATAYCKGHNALFAQKVTNFFILIITDDLQVQEVVGNSINYIPDLRYRIRRFYEQQKT